MASGRPPAAAEIKRAGRSILLLLGANGNKKLIFKARKNQKGRSENKKAGIYKLLGKGRFIDAGEGGGLMQNSFGKMAPALLLSGPVNKEMEVPTRSSRVPSGRFDFCAHPRAPCRDPAPATAPPAPGTRLLSPGLRKAAGPVSFPPLGVSPPCLPPGFVPGHPRRAVSAPLAPAGPSTRVPGAAVGDPSVAGGGDEIQGKRPGSRPASPPPPPPKSPGPLRGAAARCRSGAAARVALVSRQAGLAGSDDRTALTLVTLPVGWHGSPGRRGETFLGREF